MSRPAVFVDDIPVLFGLDNDDGDPPAEGWLEPLGDRVTYARWEGAYPLTGHMLILSLATLEHEVQRLVPPEWGR